MPADRQTPDSAIVERALHEPEVFAELFDRHAAVVHRYVLRRLGPDGADDVLSETFVVAFAGRHGYDLTKTDARPWLLGIATNLIRGKRRAEGRRWRAMARAVAAAAEEPEAERVAARLTAQAARGEMAGALARLSTSQRDVLLLYAWAELNYEEIADALDVPVGTVRSRLHRARSALREALGQAGLHTDERGGDPWTS